MPSGRSTGTAAPCPTGWCAFWRRFSVFATANTRAYRSLPGGADHHVQALCLLLGEQRLRADRMPPLA